MSTHHSRSVRSSTDTQRKLNVSTSPDPFDPTTGYTAVVSGGIPPYTWTPVSSPPNPAGVTVEPSEPDGETCTVKCPADTPPGSVVYVQVTDSSTPPRTGHGSATTAE